MHKRLFARKTIIIIMAIVAVIVLLLVFSDTFRETVEEAVLPDESKLSQTYNASRYFFRFGYPDDWSVESDVGGFGFLNDTEKGIVVQIYPTAEIGNTAAPTESPSSAVSGAVSGDQLSIVENEKISTVVNVFYRETKDGETVSSEEACKRFIVEFADGLMYEDDGYEAEYSFGNITEYVADNLTFYRVEYTCDIYEVSAEEAENSGQASETKKKIDTVSGEIYAASRSMAYYAINFETDLEQKSDLYNEYHKDFMNILNDFRFSVFED